MSTGEDEPSPNLNGRLRPRRSTNTATPTPQTKTIRKPDGKPAPDRPKRTSAPSKVSPAKQDDLVIKSDAVPAPTFLCSYCDKKFNSRQTVSKHARRIHLSTSKQDNFIKCLYCNHSDAESNDIIKHMVDSHPNQYFACLECHTRFPSTTELAEHKLNVCEKQRQPYRSKLRQKTLPGIKRKPKKSIKNEKTENSNESTRLTDDDFSFNGIVISCELKPSDTHDAADIEDKITTNLILPSSKALGNTAVEKNAVIVLDDFQWNKRIPPNFSFHNSDADQILSRLGVVHRSPRVGESRKDLIRLMDEPNEKFEKCFDTSFYSKVARNVQENLAKYLDGTFNFNPNKDITIRTRKSKAIATINTAEGFPILLSHEQFSRNMYDGFMPRAVAPKHKWKWDSAENERNLVMLLDQTKRDSHVNSCIITLISSLDIWTQLRMKNKFEEIFKTAPHAKKTEKQNIISLELKEILESRDIPSRSSRVVQYKKKPVQGGAGPELPAYLGLSAIGGECELQPAVLSGEWVRPRCFVCCACGDQTRDARTLSAHLATRHPNAQVQHYEIVGETLLSADILKHLYVPPSQMSNRTRPPRGFRDCTKCKKSVTLEDLHQHMLDCAGDTPTVRRKCRYRPFGVRRRRTRLPDNTIRKKIRKDMRSRHRQKTHIRPRPRIRTEVGDAESIRKMIADLPAKRNRITPTNVLRPRRTVLKTKKQVKHRSNEDKKSKLKSVQSFNKSKKAPILKKQKDTESSSTIDEDDQPLKLSSTRVFTRRGNSKEVLRRRATINNTKTNMQTPKQNRNLRRCAQKCYSQYNNTPLDDLNSPPTYHPMQQSDLGLNPVTTVMKQKEVIRPMTCQVTQLPTHFYSNQHFIDQERFKNAVLKQNHRERRHTVQEDRMLQYYQPAVQNAYQRIDLRSAGPSNFRRHSNCDDHNLQNRQDWPIDGGRSRNRNSNVAQTPNTPLKHSIASITTNMEGHNAALPYHNPYSMQLELNTQRDNDYAHCRNIFENEETIDKVDKPPLLNFADLSKAANDQGLLSSIPTGMSHAYMPTPCNLNMPEIPIEAQLLSNEPLGSRTGDRMFLHQASMELNNFIRQRPLSDNIEESPRFVEQPLDASMKLNNFIRQRPLSDNIEESPRLVEEPLDASMELNNFIRQRPLSDKVEESPRFVEQPLGASMELNNFIRQRPLSDNIEESPRFVEQPLDASMELNNFIRQRPLSDNIEESPRFVEQPLDASMELNNFIRQRPLSDKIEESPRFVEQPLDASMDLNNFIRQRPLSDNIEESPRFVEQPLGLTRLTGRDRENNKTRSKIEAEKVKSCKIRKRLSDCITMLQTKKGFCLNQDKNKEKSKDKDNKIIESETIDLETVDSEVRADLSLTASKITEEIDRKENNKDTLTCSYSIQDQVASDTLPNDASVAQIDNAYSRMEIGGKILTRNRDEPYLTKSLQLGGSAVPSELTITDPQGKLVPEETHRILWKGGNSTSINLRMHDMTLSVDKTHEMIQAKQQDVNLNFKQDQSKNILYEMYRKAINAPESIPLTSEGIVVASPQGNVVDSEYVNDLTRPSRQVSVSPTSRRTRRKPIKKKSDLIDQINLINEQSGRSIPEQSLQNQNSHEIVCSIDSNKAQNPSHLSEVSPSHEILQLKTPPPLALSQNSLRVRRESHRRVSETNVDNVSLTQHIRSPAEMSGENVIKLNNLRRQSYELANQIATSNYVHMMNQSYREHYEKSIINISQNSRGMHHPHMANPDDCNKDDYEKAKEIPSRFSLKSTFVSKTHDTHGIMHVNPNCNTDSSVPRETHDHLRSYENEQFMAIQTQRVENVEVPPHSLNVRNQVDKYTNQEIKAMNDTSAVLDKRQTPELYYTRSSPFSSKICNPNIINHSLDSPFAVPSTHSNNLLHIPPLSRDPHVGVPSDAPLDLTCDTKSRDQKTSSGPGKSVLERSTEICSISVNRTPDNENANSNFHQNYTTDALNRYRNSRMSKNDRIDEPVIQPKSGEYINLEKSSSELTYQPALTAAVTESEILECSDGSTNTSNKPNIDYETRQTNNNANIKNFLNEQSQSVSRGSNFTTIHDTPRLNVVPIYAQENELDHKALENKNTTQNTPQLITEPKFQEHATISNVGPYEPTNTISCDVDKINQHKSYLHIGSPVISPDPRPIDEIQDMSNQNNSILGVKSKENNAQTNNREILPENDSSQTEQDEETARKIALLPEELVKILGTIPKDHRNQLLNILPQYVATPILNVENDTRNTTSFSDGSKQNVSADNNPNRLSVNTTISSSSVIPKKRHSPSHPTGRFNSTESLATGTMPLLLAPRLSQYSPRVDKDSTNNCKGSLADSMTERSSENINLEQINKSSENDSNNVIVKDLPELSHLDKSNNVQSRATYLCPNTSQESIIKPPLKQKPSNEQTASLRAVRIKTTSSKKSFGDERKILSNVFTYSRNVGMEEKCSNLTQITSPDTVTSQNSSANPNELRYETVQISNQQQDKNDENNVTNQINTNQNKDHCHDVIKVTEPVIISETKVKNNDILTRDIRLQTGVRKNESNTSCDSLKDEQSESTISLQKSPSRTPQVSDINAGPSLEQLNSTSTFSKSKDEKSVQDLETLPFRNDEPASKSVELNSTNNDCSPNFKTITSDETIENKPVENFDDNKVCTLENERNKLSTVELPNEFRTLSTESDLKSTYEGSSKQVEPIEDDSEDDETLAVIKEKHHKTKSKAHNFTIRMGIVTDKSKSKHENIKINVLPKRQRKKLPKTSELSRKKKISRDVESLKPVIRDPYMETKCTNATESNDDLNEILLDVSPITAVIDKVNEFGVNKKEHVTDNINSKIIENINCVTNLESNEYQISHDSGAKNQHNELSRREKNVLECTAELLDKKVQESTDLKTLSQTKHSNSLLSFEDNQSNLTQTIESSQISSLPEIGQKNELDLSFSILDETKDSKNKIIKKSVKESNASKPSECSITNIGSDSQLCSEDSDVNTMHLRRSKRGKSMYVNMEDGEITEERVKKTPLTMKRLILSRVEKDRKRISESSVSEKDCKAVIDHLAAASEEPEMTKRKGKLSKRKKSPHPRRTSKKSKTINKFDHDDDFSDNSNVLSTSDSNSCILRELPNAENKINDSCIDELKCRGISENTSNLSENTTLVTNEKDTNMTEDNSSDSKETVSKRKINSNKPSEIVSSKSKKIKCLESKSQSDFDSDDDKVLLETKQKIDTEKYLDDHDLSNISKELYNNEGSPKNHNKTTDDTRKQAINVSVPSESRIACYNRSISVKIPPSSATSVKEHAAYDPYDFDFIDTIETTEPVTKKRSKNTLHSSKSPHDTKKTVQREDIKKSTLKDSKLSKTEIKLNNESDSDSSKSDVPLQKYVDERTSNIDKKNKDSKSSMESYDNSEEKDAIDLIPKCLNAINHEPSLMKDEKESECNNDNKNIINVSNIEVCAVPFELTKPTMQTIEENNSAEDSSSKEDSLNIISNKPVDECSQKQTNKQQKKTRRTQVVDNVNTVAVSSEEDQQRRSDKFMENFGFFSERIPRKSNLLASKKITETIHMISNESDDSCLYYKEKSPKKSTSNENKKKSDPGINLTETKDKKIITSDETKSEVKSIEPTINPNEMVDPSKKDDSDLDSLAAQAIMESEEVKTLENDLFSSLRAAAAEGKAGQNRFVGFGKTGDVEATVKDCDPNVSLLQIEDKPVDNTEVIKKPYKTKQNKQVGVKDKMYPDIEEVDLFEDKFDIIKRKRRSQAVAAKQTQVVAETNTSAKSRKQSERKKSAKNTKKNYRSTHVPTKAALKGFESIKISIPTHDLNMPINISPPRQAKKRRKIASRRRKEMSDYESSSSDFGDRDKSSFERDIYEFKDSEDAELFDLRPSTVMDRFRSMHNKHKLKHKEKDKIKHTDKEKNKNKEREKRLDLKDSSVCETSKERGRSTTRKEKEQGHKKYLTKDEGKNLEEIRKDINYDRKNVEKDVNPVLKTQKVLDTPCLNINSNDKNIIDSAVASTSGFAQNRIDESDYESGMSSPEGDFIFYMSNDVNCVCPSDNDSDDSDTERGCGRLNCVNKTRNADKNAAIENIFKNNAVRREKPEIKEPEKPRPNLDQLFDSLLETESKTNNSDISENKKVPTTSNTELNKTELKRNDRKTVSPISKQNLSKYQEENELSLNTNNAVPMFDESYIKTHPPTTNKKDDHGLGKLDSSSSLCQNDILTEPCEMEIFSINEKPKENLGYSLMSEESTQVTFSDIIAHNATTDEPNDGKEIETKSTKANATKRSTDYNSEDEFDIDKPETLNRQYMHLILPAEKATSAVQTDEKIGNSDEEPDSCYESAATKYLKGLSPSEAVNMEIYNTESAQSTQTGKPNRRDSEPSKQANYSYSKTEIDMSIVSKSRIRLQKYDVREIATKSKSTTSIDTNYQYDVQLVSDDDCDRNEKLARTEEPNVVQGSIKKITTTAQDVDAFTAPASVSTTEKHSPRKSDEGISTSHDYSADAFDQSFDYAGVARQRARRKCTVGKQNVLAEHWSSESEFDGAPARPNSADSVVASAPRKRKSKKKEHHSSGKKSRHLSKGESKSGRRRAVSGGHSEDSDTGGGGGPSGVGGGSGPRAPVGPKIRARATHHYWSSEGEDMVGPQPQHGWIVGDSHKKLVTMLAHAKGRKRHNADRHLD